MNKMNENSMVFINVTTETKLSVQLELPKASINFTASDESFIEEIMDFLNSTRDDSNNAIDSSVAKLEELDLSDKISIPLLLNKDPEVEDRYYLQIKFSESSSIIHALSTAELESILVAFKDADIQLANT